MVGEGLLRDDCGCAMVNLRRSGSEHRRDPQVRKFLYQVPSVQRRPHNASVFFGIEDAGVQIMGALPSGVVVWLLFGSASAVRCSDGA